MNIKDLLKSKKFKNILITIVEILVVAGIIFAALMYMQSKINKDADKTSGVGNNIAKDEEEETVQKQADEFYLQINMAKNVMVVYRYDADKKNKTAYKIFPCTLGENVKKGKYKTEKSYSWVKNNGWHRYNTLYTYSAWIQSAEYSDRYPDTLVKKSYNSVGKNKKVDKSIILYASDAAWIYNNCKDKTVLEIVKGSKKDQLPLQVEKKTETNKYCGWDPTDPDKSNPYLKKANGTIATGYTPVNVEKGEKIDYFSNLLALDETGKNITGKLKYNKIDSSKTGTSKVTYTYKLKSGKKITASLSYKVVDTTKPKVTCSKTQFTYEVKSKDQKDMNKESNAKAIKEMVRKYVSCNESDVTITITTVDPLELKEGNFPVSIKAQDKAGNVGSCQVMCEIKVKESEGNKRFEPSKAQRKKLKLPKENTKKSEKTTKEKKTKEKATKKESETTKNVKQPETTKSSKKDTTTIAKD